MPTVSKLGWTIEVGLNGVIRLKGQGEIRLYKPTINKTNQMWDYGSFFNMWEFQYAVIYVKHR